MRAPACAESRKPKGDRATVNRDALKDDLLALARKDLRERLARLNGGNFDYATAAAFTQRIIASLAQRDHSGFVFEVQEDVATVVLQEAKRGQACIGN